MTEIRVRVASSEDVPCVFGERPAAEVLIGEHKGASTGFARFFLKQTNAGHLADVSVSGVGYYGGEVRA